MRSFRFRNRGLDLLLVGDIGEESNAFRLGRDLFGISLALIEHGHVSALGRHGMRGGSTKAGTAASDENGNVLQLHDGLSLVASFVLASCRRGESSCTLAVPQHALLGTALSVLARNAWYS